MARQIDWTALKAVSAASQSGGDDEAAVARDLAEERAAILEYEAGLCRDEAERLAFARLRGTAG